MQGAQRNVHSIQYLFRNNSCFVDKDLATALWILQLGIQTKTRVDPSGKSVHFMDNFYTCHLLGETLKKFTQNEAYIIETVKFTNVDSTN